MGADARYLNSSGFAPLGTSIDGVVNPVLTDKGRIRINNTENWPRNINNKLKNSGKPYTYKRNKRGEETGKENVQVAAKKIGPPCHCKNDCFNKIGETGRNAIFNAYWDLQDYNFQTAHIQKRIIRDPIKRKRTKSLESKKNIYIQVYC